MDIIGIDLGGTKIKAGIINEEGVIKRETSFETPEGSQAILKSIVHMVHSLQEGYPGKIKAIGLGLAGRVQPTTGKIVSAGDTIPGWTGTEVKGVIERQLPFPIFVDNDVNVAALGDGWLGEARQWKHYVFVAIGTGLGGALVNRGQIISGVNGGAGEFGHMILYPNGIPCGCGKRGCIEKYVSGTALNRLAKEVDPDWDSYKLLDRFVQKNETAVKVVKQFIDDLSIVLINVQNMYDPEAIILGGGVMDSYAVWKDCLLNSLSKMSELKVNVFKSPLGNKAGMLGAARLALDGVHKIKRNR